MSQLRKLACVAVLCAMAITAAAQAKPSYEIYAIQYGTLLGLPAADLVTGADPARKIDVATMIWLVRGGGRNILVDSGFYHERFFKDWQVRDFTKPSETLARLGLKPEDITDIIIPHMHWDHADGMDLFPKAQIWIQKDEYHYYTGEAWQSKDTSDGIDEEDVLTLVKLNTLGKVSLVDGDAQQIIPGITCYIGGKHTYQSQYVGVQTAAGTVVLASDNMYLYENLDRHAPIGTTLDAVSNLRAQDRMKQIAARPELIIPGHDPAVFKRFPNPVPGVARIQ